MAAVLSHWFGLVRWLFACLPGVLVGCLVCSFVPWLVVWLFG